MSTATLLEARHVTKRFGAATAVDAACLAVAPGEIVGLLGANGAGKTTLTRLLLGLLEPDAGTVRLLGRPPAGAQRAQVGYAPQGLGLWADLSLREHLELSAAAHGRAMSGPDDAALAGVADRPVAELSLGLQRRAAVAVAAAHDPPVLVLDEPTSGMDPLARTRLWSGLRAAADRGAGVLVSTHYLAEAGQCDQVVLLAAGRVAAAGAPAELVADTASVAVTAERWERAWHVLDDAGFAVLPAGRHLRVTGSSPGDVEAALRAAHVTAAVAAVPATLEEVFLGVTGTT